MSFSLSMMDDKEGGAFVFDWLPYKREITTLFPLF